MDKVAVKVTQPAKPIKSEPVKVSLKQKLLNIQAELKAPKDLKNTFGGYDYRSAEGILEAVKPLCVKQGVVLTLDDDLSMLGERIYVVAIAKLVDIDSDQVISNKAFAREEETKKGMDASQITGAASSYARKYALNGLFAIDDAKDADATNKHGKASAKETVQQSTNKDAPMSDKQRGFISVLLKRAGYDGDNQATYLFDNYGDPKTFTVETATTVINDLKELTGAK